MKNIIDKSVIEEKLAELEQELLELERAMNVRTTPTQMEYNLMKQADKLDQQLTKVKTKISSSSHEPPLKKDHYQNYRFPIVASNA